jgi:coenzyme PQQ synthesis protein D (PqqD)
LSCGIYLGGDQVPSAFSKRMAKSPKRAESMKHSISLYSTVVASKDQACAEVNDGLVILNLKNGVYCGLDPVGTRIWKLIQKPTTVLRVRDSLLDEYQVEPGRCEADLLALLHKLADQQLVQIPPDSGA